MAARTMTQVLSQIKNVEMYEYCVKLELCRPSRSDAKWHALYIMRARVTVDITAPTIMLRALVAAPPEEETA